MGVKGLVLVYGTGSMESGRRMQAHLSAAEALWRQGDTRGALREYDGALALAREHGDEAKEGEIHLGKGFAILNEHPAAAATTTAAAAATSANSRSDAEDGPPLDPDLRALAVASLEAARDLAAKAGNAQAVAFVQQLLDSNGKLHAAAHGECEHHAACGGEEEDGASHRCSDHDEIARRTAARVSRAGSAGPAVEDGGDDDGSHAIWTADADELLIALVAKDGPRDWQLKAAELGGALVDVAAAAAAAAAAVAVDEGDGDKASRPSPPLFDADQVAARWEYLRPLVREEFARGEGLSKPRKCGHTCGTCPTRSTCHLHEAVDIEDLA